MPRNIQETAARLLRELKRRFRRKRLGVLITDTRTYPMRRGTMGVVVGYAGFSPITSYVGQQDLFGRRLKFTQANIVNALAVASVVVMGEGAESQPLALIEDAPVSFVRQTPSVRSLLVDPRDDVYRVAYAACRGKPDARAKKLRRR